MTDQPPIQPADGPGEALRVDQAVQIVLAGISAAGQPITREQRKALQTTRTEVGRLVGHLRALDGVDPDRVIIVLANMFGSAGPGQAAAAAAVLAVRAARLENKEAGGAADNPG